ncbi:MAG: DUF1116 domain-containing protein [Streptosporangiaceae bacterium]
MSEIQATAGQALERAKANAEAVRRMTGAEPVLVDVQPAGQAIPEMAPNVILTSGPPLPWRDYYGGQRNAVIYGALYEGLATDAEDADGLAPVLKDVIRASGGIPLKPLIGRALRMGDELHSRNTAATTLFIRELTPQFLDYAATASTQRALTALRFFFSSDYSFLRLSMAAAKAMADAARDVAASSVVTAMTISCRNFAIRVSGLGDEWFTGPLPEVSCKLFEGFTDDDVQWIGGESHITETVGLGGFAQAAAFGLQAYQGGSAAEMVRMNSLMYEITVAEHPDFKIPYFGFRGSPVGIDIFRVTGTGITPVIDGGLAGKNGGQIGAGILRAPVECFEAATQAYRRTYRC